MFSAARRLHLIALMATGLLLISAPGSQAQELRAAPPPEPDVLRAAPDPGTVAQENRDIAGRWLGASDAAVQAFAKAGGTLTNVATGKFTGLSTTIAIADASAVLGAASALDVRGTVSGAAAIAVGGNVTAGGAALIGEIGAATGGVIGSFLPVIGNIAGTMVGGAIGTAAGGFIAAYGYDKYVKDYVIKRVTGLVSVFDTAPLDQAMQARRAFLLQTMSPEQQAQLLGFNSEEVQLIDFAALPYVTVPKHPQPNASPPSPQDQAALTTGNVLAGVRKFSIGDQVWEISGGVAKNGGIYPGPPTHTVYTARGTVSVNRIDGTMTFLHRGEGKCGTVTRETSFFVFTFGPDTVTGELRPGPVEVLSNPCGSGFAKTTQGQNFSAPWKVVE
jgi:hypothetical protein